MAHPCLIRRERASLSATDAQNTVVGDGAQHIIRLLVAKESDTLQFLLRHS
jgi:hypothetical protein